MEDGQKHLCTQFYMYSCIDFYLSVMYGLISLGAEKKGGYTMRNIIFSLLAGAMLLSLSCGGGSTTPTVYDLSGLEGTWDYVMIVDGQITGPGGSVEYKETFTGYYIITAASVIDDEGDPWVWSYDGSTLSIQYSGTDSFWDSDCGDILVSETDKANIPLVSGATVGNVSGTIDVTFNTEFCGELTGILPIIGTMTKR